MTQTATMSDHEGSSLRYDRFPASRAEGLDRLNAFLPAAGRAYAETRGSDHGPSRRDNVSVLSRYLRYRLVTEHDVVAAALAQHGPQGAEKFVHEVLWRTYFKGWLEQRPDAWTRFLAERDAERERLARSGGLRRALAAAEAGATGIEGFDDWARELVDDGYLHNHARMWFASIWIFTLRLPWQLGADFFLRHLVDADPASNTLSWRWVAGLHTQGKTYLATADNIARYTGGRFEPRGLARNAEALSEPPLPGPRALPALGTGPDGPALLLVTAEDLNPESLVPDGASIRGALVVRGIAAPEPWPWGDKAAAFVAAAADDAADRVRERYGCAAAIVDALDASAVIAAAQAAGARSVVTAYAPVGPTADALALIAPELEAAGTPLVRLRRGWDERFWPHATKGYFALKTRIPEVLAQDGLRA